jgi:branched-chain amino acid transport system ATP-binding protein
MAEPLLKAEMISSFYARSQALFDVSVAVPAVGCVAIVGRNGAGKTTLLQTLAGEVRQSSGRVCFGETDVSDMPTEMRIRAGLGYVPQDANIFPGLTVLENLKLGAGNVADQQARIEGALDLFPKLGQRLDQKAGTLSGGERKMVAISRALLGNPRLLMLDEPTEGVWHGVVTEISGRLRQLSSTMAVLIVEQHLSLALDLSRYCYVMDRGRIALEGPTDEVRADPRLELLLAP